MTNSIKFIFIAFLFFPLLVLAQQTTVPKYNIKARLIDSASSKPIAYATVSLLNQQRDIVATAFSAENGTFIIGIDKEGNYILEITSVGYRTQEIKIELPASKKETQLGDLLMWTAAAGLQEITVVARRKLIDLRPGMLVYNAENDVTNKGGTAADVLRKTPIINVDAQGNVTMRGSGNLKILINGKYSGQIARSPADALNMMPADVIKSVEVITTPSAKYDAEGAAGVINIITKKGRKNINGALEISGSNLEQMINPRIALNNDKWSFSVHGHLHLFRQKESAIVERTQLENGLPVQQLYQTMTKDNRAPHGSGDLTLVFTPDSVSEFSLGMNSWFGKWPDNLSMETTVKQPNGTITEQYRQRTTAKESYIGTNINIGYNRKLRKPGQEITLLAQYSPSGSKLPYHIFLTGNNNSFLYEEQNNNNTNNSEWTLQADYIHPLTTNGKYTLETGTKLISRNVQSDYHVYTADQQPGNLLPDPTRSDEFDYQQKVWAIYAMLKANLPKNWYAEAGLRLENTSLEGNFRHSAAYFDNSFSNLVPTATVSKKISDDQTITLSYTQRLTRPYIWDLNPNADASDPKNIVKGNPALQPEISKQAELTYGWTTSNAFFLNSAIFWKHTGNAFVDFIETDANGISTTSKQNLAGNRVYGLNLSSSITISPVVSVNGNINLSYLKYKSDALKIFNDGWSAEMDLNTTITLPHRYSLQVFGKYDGRKVTLQGYESYQYYYSVAAKKSFEKPRLVFTLGINNPFSEYIPQQTKVISPDFHSLTQDRYYLRSIKLTVNWEFGKMFGEKERKTISNDDINGPSKG